MFKTNYEKFNEWCIDFAERFIKDICNFLCLKTIPYISIVNSTIENQTNIYGVFMIDDVVYDGYIVEGNGIEKECGDGNLIQSIAISTINIYNDNSNIIKAKLAFIHTLVHEMTHYYQFVNGMYAIYTAPSYKKSRKERHANNRASRYKKERLIHITPFLFM